MIVIEPQFFHGVFLGFVVTAIIVLIFFTGRISK